MSDDVNEIPKVVNDKPEVANPKPDAKPKKKRGVKTGSVRGPYKKRVTDDEIVTALHAHYGLIGPASKTLGMARVTLEQRIRESEFLRVQVDAASEKIVDLATQAIVRLLQADNPSAVMFTLKTKGRAFGWQEDINANISVRSTLTPDQARATIRDMFGLSESKEPEPEPEPVNTTAQGI